MKIRRCIAICMILSCKLYGGSNDTIRDPTIHLEKEGESVGEVIIRLPITQINRSTYSCKLALFKSVTEEELFYWIEKAVIIIREKTKSDHFQISLWMPSSPTLFQSCLQYVQNEVPPDQSVHTLHAVQTLLENFMATRKEYTKFILRMKNRYGIIVSIGISEISFLTYPNGHITPQIWRPTIAFQFDKIRNND